jgi:Uncharacterized protein conserved in bacteria
VICCGFGHRVLLMDVEKPLREVLERLVEERGVRVFYTGGMGEFDELFARTVRSMKRECPSLRLVLVMPYLTHKIAIGKKEDGTMYGGQIARATSIGPGRRWHEAQYDEILIPAELDGVHPKAAIGQRNRWMVDHSDIVVAALHRDFGGAAEAVRYAEKVGKEVMRINGI